jgi:general secretion pathway protein N
MRVEGISPRTWLLGTVAGWALLLWVLALVGMGGNVGRLADDPSLVPKLPALAPAPPERLGPLAQYSETTARPLFSTDRRPQPFSLTPEGDDNAAAAFDYVLTSVLITPTLKMAIVQPSEGGDSVRVKLGEAPEAQPAYRLSSIEPRSAVFEGPDGEHTLELRVFDGTGGEPPTEMQQVDADATANASADANPAANGAKPGGPARARKPATRPATPKPATPPQQQPPATDESAEPEDPNTQAQLDAIRKRIEQRRAQLREQAENPAAPAKNP